MIEKLKKILSKYADISAESITKESVILRDLGLNSYSLMEAISDIEDEFDLDIPDAALSEMKTIGDLITFIEDAT